MSTPPQDAFAAFDRDRTFANYQAMAATTAVYPDAGNCLLYPVLGLADEACEVAGAVRAIFDTQYSTADYPALAALLEALRDVGKLAGIVKKLHRDSGGVVSIAAATAAQGVARGAIAGLERFAIALADGGVVRLPPLEYGEAVQRLLVKEVGDVQWYVSGICTEMRVALGVMALANGEKLAGPQGRAARGALHGSGDDR